MYLKSLTLKGFKSFAQSTRLDFGPGVSVIVGPNGSGKSNVTDAVMWAMGEQSPLAVRGQSMQDVIFGGAQGVQPRSFAEVELILDNSDGTVELPLGEISIVRRLDRAGEGEYRLCGARCRLADVIEVLSDTGLGKETHSVISQGRVEAIVTSKPRDRRLLIEEAAGLGKHRSRRRRAQLKLERTQENLDRALDVEREARGRLRPLKRQAEAAELHERLERQMLDVRLGLAREDLRGRAGQLEAAEELARAAREARTLLEHRLQAVVDRRTLAERALAERAERHDALAGWLYRARAAQERLQLRREQAQASAGALAHRALSAERELEALAADDSGEQAGAIDGDRVQALERQLAEIERDRELEIERELADLQDQRGGLAASLAELQAALSAAQQALEDADARASQAREALRAAERAAGDSRREAARVGAELVAVNQFLCSHAHPLSRPAAGAEQRQVVALGERLGVQTGYELALAAVLGRRLEAALAADLPGAVELLEESGPDGGAVLLAGQEATRISAPDTGPGSTGDDAGTLVAGVRLDAPCAGARSLLELVSGPPALSALATKLLGRAWVVERLEDLPADFDQIAVTPAGRVWFGASGEVRQVNEGGAERVLASRNERERLLIAGEAAGSAERAAEQDVQRCLAALRDCETDAERAREGMREVQRRRDEMAEQERRVVWLMEQREQAPRQGPLAVRRAQLEGELAAERRQLERSERQRRLRVQRLDALRDRRRLDVALIPRAERLSRALASLGEAAGSRAGELELGLAGDRAAGEEMATELRGCAAEEAEIQALLRGEGEAVTAAEVSAQRLRDQAHEARLELESILMRLGIPEEQLEPARVEPLTEDQRLELQARLQRLERRREQLGPVNPLAQEEYADALEHVEELESRRADLEGALRELRGVIRDTDRQIQDTFEATFAAAARNFEQLVGDVFPGGQGRLRLLSEQVSPRTVLGGQVVKGACVEDREAAIAASESAADAEEAAQARADQPEVIEDQEPGVEIELTPAGKMTKRLSLLSGGEKSMTALAFLFAVFLARPCPFYILDEVEAALDDLNLDRFLVLLRRYADRAQFIVITHQKRTMEAADWLYGVSMAADGVSKVISRRLAGEAQETIVPQQGVSEAA
jgi:chromosome segregation protein